VRILNVSQNYFVAGGMDVMMFALERVLQTHGHVVVPFTAADSLNQSTSFDRYFPAAPRIEAARPRDLLRMLYSPKAKRAIGRVLDEQQIDLVHLHSYFKRLTPAILPEISRRGIPIVQTLHEYRAVCPVSTLFRDGHVCTDCRGRRYRHVLQHRCAGGLARSAWNYAEMHLSDLLGHKRDIALYITISDYQRNKLIEMGMPADVLRTIPNPVAFPLRDEAAPRSSEHVLYFGRLEPYKGIFDMLELASGLPNLRFLIVGDGSVGDEVRYRARSLGNVEIRSSMRDAPLIDVIDRAICVVVPSRWPEAFGLTAIEAQARGIPVVASRIGGMTETVRDGIDGLLVTPGDIDGLIASVRAIAEDSARGAAMGRAALSKVAEQYGTDRFYHRIMDVYHSATDQASTGRSTR